MTSLFEELLQNIPAIFYRCSFDKDWSIHFINSAITHMTGYPTTDFINNRVRSFVSIIHPDDVSRVEGAIRRAIERQTAWRIDYRILSRDQQTRWVSETGVAVFSDAGEVIHLDGFIQDISDRKRIEMALKASEQQVRDMAYTDSVTGLANRNLFTDRLDQLVLYSMRYGTEFALLFIDLDHFKSINDTHGHLAGDKLLALAAERIGTAFRESDVVARFGGDEFLVIVKNTGEEATISALVSKLLSKLAAPYLVNDLELFITASIGIARCPHDGSSSRELIQHADQAMYSAKMTGKNRFCLYSDTNEGQKSAVEKSPCQ